MAIFVSFCSFSVKPTDSAYQTHIHYWSVSYKGRFGTIKNFEKFFLHFSDLKVQKWPSFFAVTKFLESSEKWMLCPRDCSFDYFWGLIFWIFSVSEMAIFWDFLSFFTNSCPFGSKIWQFFWKIWKSIWKLKCLLRLVTTDPICHF